MLNDIRKKYKHHKSKPMIPFSENAVMILLQEVEEDLNIIFEVRALHLKNQPGDICLPGGKIEKGEDSKEAALREAMEELNFNKEDIEYIGEMDYLLNPYGILIYPHIGYIRTNEISPNPGEVDHIFKVPISYFINNPPEGYDIKVGPTNFNNFPFKKIRGGKKYPFRTVTNTKYFYEYNNYTIWGFTAKIIKYFIDSIV